MFTDICFLLIYAKNEALANTNTDVATLKTDKVGKNVYVNAGQTANVYTTAVCFVLASYSDSGSFIARVSSSGVTAVVGSIPSTIVISSISGGKFTITNNVAWAIPFTVLGNNIR